MANDWIFTEEELRASPSHRDGMQYVDELLARRKACNFIDKMAKSLSLARLAQNSAYNYLHRFYMRQSFVRYDKYLAAAACVLLGSKAEECLKKIGFVAQEYVNVRKLIEKDQVFAIQKHDPKEVAAKIVQMESLVLHTLAYDLALSHPYVYVNENLHKVMRLVQHSPKETQALTGKIKQVAWSFLNDSAYTCACLRLEAHELAAGAVYLAGLYENYVPSSTVTSDGLPWWNALSSPVYVLNDAARHLLNAYREPYLSTQALPTGLSKLLEQFHPSTAVKFVEDPKSEDRESPCALESPMCVTSPECNSCDHDLDFSVKRDGEDSPRETAFVAGRPSFNGFHGSRPKAAGKRSRDVFPDMDMKRRKCAL